MGVLFVAASKIVQDWAADVGLGKHVYKVGFAQDGDPTQSLSGQAGADDWKILESVASDGPEDELLARLAKTEKLVDPNYYPRLKGATGIVKMSLDKVENAVLVAYALENREPPKGFKVKPADIARYLVRNLTK